MAYRDYTDAVLRQPVNKRLRIGDIISLYEQDRKRGASRQDAVPELGTFWDSDQKPSAGRTLKGEELERVKAELLAREAKRR